MHRFLAAPLLALLLMLVLALPALAAKPKEGDVLPDLEIKTPLKPAEQEYLGLPAGAKSWRLSQIKAETLLVEIFSMYCPRCQAEAPAVNRVFEKLMASPQGAKLKFVAIGAGNSQFEVDFFRKKYQAGMPMVQDADYKLHKAFMGVGTPSYFVLKSLPGGKGLKVLYFREGQFEDEDAFLEQVLRAAGAK
ncbi:MAG: redoxin domain-containing protein [Desulfovibrio sp.]|jgi:thiol-disulfide isomerase/thioredoxin|nr:redoxin domain-containing protein [Desulfovibrio sp.]